MKVLSIILGFTMLLLLPAAYAMNPNNPADEEAVKQVIEDYVKGTDNQNAELLEKILYPEGNYFNYNAITNKVSQMTNDQFLEKVKKGQTGGWERQLNINSVDVNDNTAMAKIEVKDARMMQHGYLTLVKEDGKWKIMSGAYTLEAAK
ncbi:MAG: nuclear transport factor 2 family protein [Ignavibacteriaceae bacterium]